MAVVVSPARTSAGIEQDTDDREIERRASRCLDVPPLRTAGAERVFSGEGEVGLAMTEAVLQRLGATPDQIDRERARVRQELYTPAV